MREIRRLRAQTTNSHLLRIDKPMAGAGAVPLFVHHRSAGPPTLSVFVPVKIFELSVYLGDTNKMDLSAGRCSSNYLQEWIPGGTRSRKHEEKKKEI